MTQSEALDILKLGKNVFLTGSAGSGKTYVLRQYIDYVRSHDVEIAVTASTGIAATHMNGVTIHSWTGLGIRDSLSPMDLESMEEKQYLWKRFERTKILVIDEVSMLHHFRLDLVDRICRSFKRTDKPFGGMQVILAGDFFQLPPVSRNGEEPAYFVYHSNAWKNMGLTICYLHEEHRHKDKAFLEVLNGIRRNLVSDESLAHLETRKNASLDNAIRPTKLYTHNIDVGRVNDVELEKLSGETHTYHMKGSGNPHLVESLKKSTLAPEVLRLKKNAQVMFVKNNYEEGYVNGTQGVVEGFDADGIPLVRTFSGELITAEPVDWQIEDGGRVLASITQIPLRLAWAITVHKSQGMSLDAAEIDLSKSFEKGMGYVALSRVRSLKGLSLLGLNPMALEVDQQIVLYDKSLQEESSSARELFVQVREGERLRLQKEFIIRIAPKGKGKKEAKVVPHHLTKNLLKEHKSLKEIAKEREVKVETILTHIEKLKAEGETLDIEYLKEKEFSDARFEKIAEAFADSFKKVGDYRLAPVKNALGSGFSYEEVRLARLFIEGAY